MLEQFLCGAQLWICCWEKFDQDCQVCKGLEVAGETGALFKVNNVANMTIPLYFCERTVKVHVNDDGFFKTHEDPFSNNLVAIVQILLERRHPNLCVCIWKLS